MTDQQDTGDMGAHLGPWPEATVAMFADLGLAEDEIARHLRIDRAKVRQLQQRAGRPDGLPPWVGPAEPPDAPALPDPPDPAPAPRRWCCCALVRAFIERLCRR